MQRLSSRRTRISILFALSLLVLGAGILFVQGDPVRGQANQEIDALRRQISDRSAELIELQREISKYQKELEAVGAEKRTLETAIRELDLSRDKIATDIEVTENRIEINDLQIQKLTREIQVKELEIDRNTELVAGTIRDMDEIENTSFIETLLKHDNISEFWDTLEELSLFQEEIKEQLQNLMAVKASLETDKDELQKTVAQLAGLYEQLEGEKYSLDVNREEKDALLSETENEEATYQEILEEKRAARDRFEAELRQLESQLQFHLDKSTIPVAGSGVLKWPFSANYFSACPSFSGALGNSDCITQYFGNTPFAKSGAYNGSGHNGIDFRAPVGTQITAALSGTVAGTGNTDAVSGCYSYGKWVLIRHNNGIATLYAHLSSITVSPGQSVATGQLIGYSGNTGYVTGPHLHFTVYASEGVKVQRLGDIPGRPITGCSAASIPVAALEAYLNPLDYL
jgi:murein DD-endopeptidase MepM/ murein hydrolase activator NlpD